jgi:hypothetical protein
VISTRRPKPETVAERRECAWPIEVLDVQAPAFRAEARRQSLAFSTGPSARADQAFNDAVSGWSDE